MEGGRESNTAFEGASPILHWREVVRESNTPLEGGRESNIPLEGGREGV